MKKSGERYHAGEQDSHIRKRRGQNQEISPKKSAGVGQEHTTNVAKSEGQAGGLDSRDPGRCERGSGTGVQGCAE